MKKVIVDKDICICCGQCYNNYGDIFTENGGFSEPLNACNSEKTEALLDDDAAIKSAISASEMCPTGAIEVKNVNDKKEEQK